MPGDYLYSMNPINQAARFLIHQVGGLISGPVDPFQKEFLQQVMRDDTHNADFQLIEQIRGLMLQDGSLVTQHDPGAGSRGKNSRRTVAEFTRLASVRPHYGRMLYRLARFLNPPLILELGTAVGLGTLYLAFGCPEAQVITVEGNPQLADLASGNFRMAGAERIVVMPDCFDNVLSGWTGQIPRGSIVFIDGNHTGEALKRYFNFFTEHVENLVIVADDINWSESMHQAWTSLLRNAKHGLWIDLFQMGLYLDKYAGDPQFVRIRY